ncbi:DUF393 domain-containing protein [Paenibacillaceae bacterium]|nr:DUF393 domain-containing protein [Paenibacillaceae bacterium]
MKRKPILLLIDGQCTLCHGIARFVIRRDRDRQFYFASIQSPLGQRMLAEGRLPGGDLDTFVMIVSGKYYTRSGAALRVVRRLGGLWPLLSIGMLAPGVLRDFVYNLIARNRYRWFGSADACLVPTADVRSRLLEEVEDWRRLGNENKQHAGTDIRGN